MRLGVAVCAPGTGMWIVIGALAALQARHTSGEVVSSPHLCWKTALVWAGNAARLGQRRDACRTNTLAIPRWCLRGH